MCNLEAVCIFTDAQMARRTQIAIDLDLSLEFLKENSNIILSKADKGGITVISERDTILRLRDDHLSVNMANGTYSLDTRSLRHINSHLVNAWFNLVKAIGLCVRHVDYGGSGIGPLSNTQVLALFRCTLARNEQVYTPGRMYGQLKVHKPHLAYRPIVDNSIKLGGPLQKYMLKIPKKSNSWSRGYGIRTAPIRGIMGSW